MEKEMYNNEVDEYLDDIFDICDIPDRYSNLIYFMFDKAFFWVRELDENRARDVISILRFPHGFDDEEEEFPVSILEVFVAMSMRVATEVIGDGDVSKYFFQILELLGLDKYENSEFDEEKVDYILDDFMKNNGKSSCKHDFLSGSYHQKSSGGNGKNGGDKKIGGENFDIWKQFCLFLSENCL